MWVGERDDFRKDWSNPSCFRGRCYESASFQLRHQFLSLSGEWTEYPPYLRKIIHVAWCISNLETKWEINDYAYALVPKFLSHFIHIIFCENGTWITDKMRAVMIIMYCIVFINSRRTKIMTVSPSIFSNSYRHLEIQSTNPLLVILLTKFLTFQCIVYRIVQSQVKPTLDKLNADPDVDVKYFASEAITSIAG